MTSNWQVYLLACGTRTYIGMTNNVTRRLRQHNREIVGGARSTEWGAPNWRMVLYVDGFTTRSEACRWEKLAKLRSRGLNQRMQALTEIAQGRCPPGGPRKKHYHPPENLCVIIGV